MTVTTDTFKHIFESMDNVIENIKLVKVDVEGNELKTIRGMEEWLGKIESVWCEVRGPQSGRNANSYKAVSEIMESNSFKTNLYDKGE